MKKVLSLVLVLCMMLALAPGAEANALALKDESIHVFIDGEWDFKYYANANEVPRDVTGIEFKDKIQVPGAMELQGYGYPSYYYEEVTDWGMPEDDGVRSAGVYRTVIDVPHTPLNEYSYIVFDKVRDEIAVYLDGEKIGESRNGAVGATIEYTLPSGDHELVCVVKRDNSGINKNDNFALSGIMGDVYLAQTKEVKVSDIEVRYTNGSLFAGDEKVVLKGVKYTPTHPETGDMLTEAVIDKDIAIIKEYGFNAVLVSCAPEYFYAQAERAGLYVIDEANVNLAYADRDMEAAKARVEAMIEKHGAYSSVIMWSVGSSEGNSRELVELVKKLDKRPVAQEVTFAPDFEVFGNTGGMADWVETLGKGNVGGFVDEFADKELYYTQSAYVFDVKDSVTGENVTVDGEVKNYKGVQYLGDASFVRDIDKLDKYTIVTELATVDGDRVIFESGNVKFEVRGGRARFSVGNARARADVQEGKIAAVYRDGEIQLFVNNSFVENAEADAKLEGTYKVGGGETAISYIEIYNDALTLDELLEGADEEKLISRVQFDDIKVKEDKSYKFLAYGGDFGDNPNSYYKCLTGIFTSTREPHVEAEAFRELLADRAVIGMATVSAVSVGDMEKVALTEDNGVAVWSGDKFKATVDFEGKITSYTFDGKELLTDAMYPTVLREGTLNEYEMGIWPEEGWRALNHRAEDNVFFVEVISAVTDAKLSLAYYMTMDGAMHVSIQSQFADDAQKPTFMGFRGAGEYDNASWLGKALSSYPDRESNGATTLHTMDIDAMTDNYTIAQENGNKVAMKATLTGKDGKVLGFGAGLKDLNFQVHNYSPYAVGEAERISDIEKGDKAYFRVGGYIAGLGDDGKYKLNNNVYGFDFSIIPFECDYIYSYDEVAGLYIPADEGFSAFTHMVKDYVVNVNNPLDTPLEVWGLGSEYMGKGTDKAAVGDYTVYFAPKKEYLSDMNHRGDATVSNDKDFNGNAISIRGNGWEPGATYDKGVSIKGGSATYTIPHLTDHTFTAVIGKADFDWRRMGGGFDRSMFDATATITIALDDKVVYEKKDVSMRSGSERISIDVSGATEMTITVTGSGKAANYEDAVIADAVFVPNGPVIVDFVKEDGKAKIVVLNTDKDYVDVVLTATENGVVTTEAVSMGKGLYKAVEVKAGDGAIVKAYITGVGEIVLE